MKILTMILLSGFGAILSALLVGVVGMVTYTDPDGPVGWLAKALIIIGMLLALPTGFVMIVMMALAGIK